MTKEAEDAGERSLIDFKQRAFSSAFGAFDPANALKRYYATFEDPDKPSPEHDYEVEEFVPESPEDVLEMLNTARRAGVIN